MTRVARFFTPKRREPPSPSAWVNLSRVRQAYPCLDSVIFPKRYPILHFHACESLVFARGLIKLFNGSKDLMFGSTYNMVLILRHTKYGLVYLTNLCAYASSVCCNMEMTLDSLATMIDFLKINIGSSRLALNSRLSIQSTVAISPIVRSL